VEARVLFQQRFDARDEPAQAGLGGSAKTERKNSEVFVAAPEFAAKADDGEGVGTRVAVGVPHGDDDGFAAFVREFRGVAGDEREGGEMATVRRVHGVRPMRWRRVGGGKDRGFGRRGGGGGGEGGADDDDNGDGAEEGKAGGASGGKATGGHADPTGRHPPDFS